MEWQEIIQEKIFQNRNDLAAQMERWKNFNDTVVFTNGCFDILHMGHLDYLSKAAELGDRFIIAVNSDSSVQALKGADRPVISEDTRMLKLASLAYVDAVILFSEDTPLELIKTLKPDILVKGGDYQPETVVGATEVQDRGGRVEIIPFLKGHSTSSIIDKIKNS